MLSLFYTFFSFMLYLSVSLLLYFKLFWNHFASTFRISISKNLSVVNSFWEVLFISLSFLNIWKMLKDVFYVCIFSFSTMMVSFHKLHFCYWDIGCQSNYCSLEVILLFSLNIFIFIFEVLQFHYDLYRYGFVFIYSPQDSFNFLNLSFGVSPQFWKLLAIFSLSMVSLLFYHLLEN